jgi:hypothetical protein
LQNVCSIYIYDISDIQKTAIVADHTSYSGLNTASAVTMIS